MVQEASPAALPEVSQDLTPTAEARAEKEGDGELASPRPVRLAAAPAPGIRLHPAAITTRRGAKSLGRGIGSPVFGRPPMDSTPVRCIGFGAPVVRSPMDAERPPNGGLSPRRRPGWRTDGTDLG